MAQFLSDLLSLTTLSVAGGAIALGNVSLTPDVDAPRTASVNIVAEEAIVTEVSNTTPQTPLPQVASLQTVDIPQAKLLQVSFIRTEDELFPSRTSSRLRGVGVGRVTGTAVNLRGGPGTGFAVAGRAVRDQEFAVTGETDGRWVQVLVDDIAGPVWIHGKFFQTN